MTADTLNIEPLTNESEPLWEGYVLRHPAGTNYHRLFWKNLFCKTFGYDPFYLLARRGKKVTGVMPLFKIPMLRGSLMSSIPFRDRAQPLADDEESFKELLKTAVSISRENGCVSLLIKSLEPLPSIDATAGEFSCSSDWVRSYVELPKGPNSKDIYWKRINENARRNIRRAETSGLEFSSPEKGDSKVSEAVDLLRETQHRLGIPPFPEAFYLSLIDSLRENHAGELCLVTHQNRIVATAILLIEADNAIYGYAGSDPKAWPMRVNDFLVWSCLCLAIKLGKSTFDFGGDSSKQKTLLFFKKKWDARAQELHYYSRSTDPKGGRGHTWRDSSKGLYPFARSIVRKLPVPLYRLTGYFTRYFG